VTNITNTSRCNALIPASCIWRQSVIGAAMVITLGCNLLHAQSDRARDAPVAEAKKDAGAKQQCVTWIENSRDMKQCFPFETWVLTYQCDSGQGDQCENFDQQRRSFGQKQWAIDWAEENYRYSPVTLQHEGEFLTCHTTYLYRDDDVPSDSDRWLMKSVECMTDKEFQQKYCQDDCTSSGDTD
jgi:hypothetical protein